MQASCQPQTEGCLRQKLGPYLGADVGKHARSSPGMEGGVAGSATTSLPLLVANKVGIAFLGVDDILDPTVFDTSGDESYRADSKARYQSQRSEVWKRAAAPSTSRCPALTHLTTTTAKLSQHKQLPRARS